jgi:hypothetical protein
MTVVKGEEPFVLLHLEVNFLRRKLIHVILDSSFIFNLARIRKKLVYLTLLPNALVSRSVYKKHEMALHYKCQLCHELHVSSC